MTGTETRSLLDAARELAPKIRAAADEIEAERELPRALFEALADAGFYHMAVPRSLGGAELDLPTYIQVIEELGKADASTAWTINQGAIYATYAARMPPRHGSRDLDRHAPCRRLQHPGADGDGHRGARRVPGHRPPGLQHRLPARGLGRGARAGDRERRGADRRRQRPAGGAVSLRARGRGGAARHLACPGHARHRHASLRGERRVRARRAHGPVGHGAALRDAARSTRFPERSCSPRAMPRWRSAWPARVSRRSSSWRAPRHRGRCPGCCASSPWSRWTSATPRRTSAPAGPS